MGEILSYRILSVRTAAEGDREGLRIGWLKKRKPNEVVPMRMSEEKPNLGNLFFLGQSLTKISNSRTGINNNNESCLGPDLETGGVSAIAQGSRPRRSERATATPDFNFHDSSFFT
jgi:hypothetical protein